MLTAAIRFSRQGGLRAFSQRVICDRALYTRVFRFRQIHDRFICSAQYADKQLNSKDDVVNDSSSTDPNGALKESPSTHAQLLSAEKYIAEKDKEIAHLQEKILRILAENENIRHRHELELSKAHAYSISKLAEGLLDVCDNLELALHHVERNSSLDAHTLVEGIQITLANLNSLLEKFSVVAYESLDVPFSPSLHNVLHEIDAPKSKGTVVQVIKKGYKIKDRILR